MCKLCRLQVELLHLLGLKTAILYWLLPEDRQLRQTAFDETQPTARREWTLDAAMHATCNDSNAMCTHFCLINYSLENVAHTGNI